MKDEGGGKDQAAGQALDLCPFPESLPALAGRRDVYLLAGRGRPTPEGDLMKLSRASSYALSAVAYMAAKKTDVPIASHVVAKALGIPELFLLKVLKSLVSVRILVSLKGPNGGYRLARPAKDISLLEIVEAVDGPIRGEVPAVAGDKGDGKLDRKLDTICKETAEMVRERFGKIRITTLAGK